MRIQVFFINEKMLLRSLVMLFILRFVSTEIDDGHSSQHQDVLDEIQQRLVVDINSRNKLIGYDNLKVLFNAMTLNSSACLKQTYNCPLCLRASDYMKLKGYETTRQFSTEEMVEVYDDIIYILRNRQKSKISVVCKTFNEKLLASLKNSTSHELFIHSRTDNKLYKKNVQMLLKDLKNNIGVFLTNHKCFSVDSIFDKINISSTTPIADENSKYVSANIILNLLNKNCIDLHEEHEDDEEDHHGEDDHEKEHHDGDEHDGHTDDDRAHHDHYDNELKEDDHHTALHGEHDDEHVDDGHLLPNKTFFISTLLSKYGNSTHVTYEGFLELVETLKLDQKADTRTRDNHKGHKYKRKRKSTYTSLQCYSPKELLTVYGIAEHTSINKATFREICAALIQQLDIEECKTHEEEEESHSSADRSKSWKPWVGALVANFIITLGSVAGIFAAPLHKKPYFNYVLMFLICLAISTLIGDALLHLLPHSLDLHKHDEHDHSEGNEFLKKDSFLWKFVLLLFGVYLFFNFEILMHAFGGKHGHTHGNDLDILEDSHKHAGPTDIANIELVKGTLQMNEDTVNPYMAKCDGNSSIIQGISGMHECKEKLLDDQEINKEKVVSKQCDFNSISSCDDSETQFLKQRKGNFRSVVWMVLFGDAIHNFMDGIAIGVAFTEPWPSGLHGGISTSIAILCHELPHELGDFAILINSGMTIKQALMVNFISSLTSFVGVIVGVVLGTQWNAVPWLFALTSGLFIYIALVDMLPEMIHNSILKLHPIRCFLLQNTGLIIGFIAMFSLAAWEEDLKGMIS